MFALKFFLVSSLVLLTHLPFGQAAPVPKEQSTQKWVAGAVVAAGGILAWCKAIPTYVQLDPSRTSLTTSFGHHLRVMAKAKFQGRNGKVIFGDPNKQDGVMMRFGL
jgi:hypothetical protein